MHACNLKPAWTLNLRGSVVFHKLIRIIVCPELHFFYAKEMNRSKSGKSGRVK